MGNEYLSPGGNKNPRDVDRLASKTRSLWSRTYVFIKKANIRSWKRVFALAFITGAIVATIWTISLKIISLTHSAGETAILELSASSNSVAVGETFDVDIVLNTNLNKVVVAKAMVSYNSQNFQLVSWDTANSTFAVGNTCQYQGKACEIVNNDTVGGKITITVAKPSPGVSSTTATVGTLKFKALKPITPTARNIEIIYSPYSTTQGSYDDSDAILDDGKGTDILTSVSGETVAIQAPTCTSFTYSAWGACQTNNTQSRTVATSIPTGCAGGNPVLSQSCTYQAPTCTSFTYSAWGACQQNNTQTRTVVTNAPANCTGGSPILSQSCTYQAPTCTSFTYSDWGACQTNNTQSRTVATSSPSGCTGGTPSLSQSCTYNGGPTICTSFTYSSWGACQPNNTQSRNVATSSPSGCTGGSPSLSRSCTYQPATCTSFTYSDWGACQQSNTQSRTVATSSPSGCTGGTPSLSQSCTYQTPTCSSFTYSNWNACQPNNTQSRTVATSSPAGCTGGSPDLQQACTYPGSKPGGGNKDKNDKNKPKFAKMPSFLYKNRGDKVWWSATDNVGIDHYTYSLAGKTKTTKSTSFNIPVNTSRGLHLLIIRAYDEAGNMKRKYVTVWVK